MERVEVNHSPVDHEAWHAKLSDDVDRLFTSEQELLAENTRLRALLEKARDYVYEIDAVDYGGHETVALRAQIDAALVDGKREGT